MSSAHVRIVRPGGWVLAGLVAALLGLVACSVNPATGRRQFNIISTQQEIALGAQASPEFLKEYGGPIPSQRIQDHVRDMGMRMARESERPELPWEFHVVDSPVINAFALPGGKVFVTRGLMALMDNEAQLAGVIGHEIGHVTAQHIGQRMSQALAVQGVAVGIGVAGAATDEDWLKALGVGATAGGTLYLLKFGRDQEMEADSLGMRYMTRVGYNPLGQVQVMEILGKAAGSGARPPEFLSTHPTSETRIRELRREIRRDYPGVDNPSKYTFGFESFKANIAEPLKALPPAKPTQQQAMALAQLAERARRWEHGAYDDGVPDLLRRPDWTPDLTRLSGVRTP